MLPRLSTLLGVGLLILWVAELGSPDSPSWLTWLDGIAVLGAFGIAIYGQSMRTKGRRAAGPLIISAGLFALWIAALISNIVPWPTWFNFAFACAFLILGLLVGSERRAEVRGPSEIEKERMRRGA